MERERFLDSVAHRLGRPRLLTQPERPNVQAPWPLVEAPLADRFCRELERVGGTWSRAASATELESQLCAAIMASGDSPSVAVGRRHFRELSLDFSRGSLDRLISWGDGSVSDPGEFRATALRADLGVTTAACAVASTGTLLLTVSRDAPRSVSLLPRRHFALIRENQIVPDLETALQLGAAATPSFSSMPSALLCISGPSRTSDIENDLSIGVHGPEEVHVIIVGGAAS